MELALLGYFSKTHGVKGQLLLRADHDFDAQGTRALFVDQEGSRAPYFVVELRAGSSGYLVELEEVNSVENARALVGKAVYIEAALLIAEEEEPDFTGFELVDAQYGSLGTILELSDNGAQVLASLRHGDKEVILPLVEAFIERVDEEQKKIFYTAPDGLISLYLSE